MPIVTVCIPTLRSDYCLIDQPDMPLFENMMRSLRAQTFKDFNVVIADMAYEERKDYFKKNPEDFEVIHVPTKPNIWSRNGLITNATNRNTCILYATGEVLVWQDDTFAIPPNYIQEVVDNIYKHKCVVGGVRWILNNEVTKTYYPPRCHTSGASTSILLETMLDINGFEELWDGGRGQDIDLGRRLAHSKPSIKSQPLKSICVDHLATGHDYSILLGRNYIKLKQMRLGPRQCKLFEYIMIQRAKRGIVVANSTPLDENDLRMLVQCADHDSGVCWFKKDKVCTYFNFPCQHGYIQLYKHPSLAFSLREMRRDVPGSLLRLEKLCQQA